MPIKTAELLRALSMIHEDGNGFFCAGNFVDLEADIYTQVGEDRKLQKLRHINSFITQDIWNIETIILRTDWQKQLLSNRMIEEYLWREFTTCDIELFHITFRSLFDHIALFISLVAYRPGQIPETFEDLRTWIDKKDNGRNKLGDDLSVLVRSCDWFSELREIRNNIVHYGGKTTVFLVPDRICFQVLHRLKRSIHIPEIMFNENVVDFELYAGMFVGYLLSFLEDLAIISRDKLGLAKIGGDPKNYHLGLRIVKRWIEDVANIK